MSNLRLSSFLRPQSVCSLATLAILGALTIVVSHAQDNPAMPAAPIGSAAPATSASAAASGPAAGTLAATGTTPAGSGARRGARGSATGARGSGAAPAARVATIARDALPFSPKDYSKADPKLVSLVIAGDSTAQTGTNAQRGWAALLIDYFDTSKINIVNPSIGGRSFRLFYHEGNWAKLVAGLKPGDIVMIQFGHNDSGDINAANGRAAIAGDGDQTQDVTHADGSVEVVHTLGWYLRTYLTDIKAKGAIAYIMSATPYNRATMWTNGVLRHSPGDNSAVQKKIADELKIPYLDHTEIIDELYDRMGMDAVLPLSSDGLHNTTQGAILNAEMFVAGIKTMDIKVLTDALNDKGKAIPAYVPAPAKPAVAANSAPTPAASPGSGSASGSTGSAK